MISDYLTKGCIIEDTIRLINNTRNTICTSSGDHNSKLYCNDTPDNSAYSTYSAVILTPNKKHGKYFIGHNIRNGNFTFVSLLKLN